MLSRFLWILTLASCAMAQGTNGTFTGQVTDQGGAVVPGAKVVLRNETTSFTREVSTNSDGQYSAYAMPPGQYRIVVEHPGIQKLVRTGVELTSADAITVDLRLAVGDVQQTVEVTAAAPLLQAQNAMVS